jgi:prophage DNA circulation protein
MTWRDDLVSASFRGAEFFVASAESTVGRKTRFSNFWGTDETYIEDLGRATDEFMIEGYVIANIDNGFNYFEQRDQLIMALTDGVAGSDNYVKNNKGQTVGSNRLQGSVSNPKTGSVIAGMPVGKPGTLRHPFYGEIEAYLKEPAKITESFEEGGIARFQMVFIRWQQTVDTGWKINMVADFALQGISTFNGLIDNFQGIMSIGGAFLSSINGVMKTVLRGISKAIGSIQGALASTINAAQAIVNNSLNFADSVLSDPCEIASTIGGGVDSILSVCGMAGDNVQSGVVGACSGELRGSIYTLDGTSIPEKLTTYAVRALLNAALIDESYISSSIPSEQSDNATAVLDLFQGICLNNASQIAIRGEYVSKEKAQQVLNDVTDSIDAYLLRLGERSYDNTLAYQSIEDMRNGFINTMYSMMVNLEQVTDYSVPVNGQNTLALAYAKFDDVYRDTEIYEMNKPTVYHPGFITGGSTITILDS